jgi:apolipoprotein N-acyltransferase
MLMGAPRKVGNAPADGGGAAELIARIRDHAEALGTPILFGAYVPGVDGVDGMGDGARGPDRGARNAAVLMRPSGLDSYRYDKRRLVPLVETARWSAPGRRTGIVMGGFAPGRDDEPPLHVADARVGVLVCFEAIFAADARAARSAGAEILVNITNDGWFGAAGVAGRVALHQHAAHLVMRAIETRAGAVRAANEGFSFHVDPVGRVHGLADPREGGMLRVATIRTTDVTTFFVRYGDLLGPASALSVLLLALSGWLLSYRGAGGGRSPSLDPRSAPL